MKRRLLVILVVACTMIAGLAAPASAGTLTSTSFTASNTYVYSPNTSYDWGFTTATTNNLAAVSATVPAGTDVSNRYVALPGINGNWVSTPDTAANSITGDIDIRVKAALTDWTPGGWQGLASKWTGGDRGWYFNVMAGGDLQFMNSTDGTSFAGYIPTADLVVADGAPLWTRVTLDVDDGGGGKVVTFYTSIDGSSWSQLGTPIFSAGTTSIYDSAQPVGFGAGWGGTDSPVDGKIYYGEVRNGIGGTVVTKFDPSDATVTQAAAGSWTSSSPQAETWTVNRSGTDRPADVAGDLTVVSTSGIPSTGSASFRFMDGVAFYYMPSNPSISASTPCTLVLSGFINTATEGNYTSLITTWNSSATAIDSATTAALSFTDYDSSQSVTTTVDPSMTFYVGAWNDGWGNCANEAQTAGTSTSATTANLGHLSGGSSTMAAQQLIVTTNAGGNWVISIRSDGALRSAAHNFTDVPGSNASPATFPSSGTEAFGYYSQKPSRFNSGGIKYAALATTSTAMAVGSPSGPPGDGFCVAYKAQSVATTPAGAYSTTVIYTAVPTF